MWTNDLIKSYLKEFRWEFNEVDSPVANGVKTIVTNFNASANPCLIPITFLAKSPFLYVSTNKLFKIKDPEKVVKFLEWNDGTPAGKWLAYKNNDYYSVNYAFEIHDDFCQNKDLFFFQMDCLTFYVNAMLENLQKKGWVVDGVLTPPGAISKDSLDLV